MSKGTHVILDCEIVPADVCLDDKRLLEVAAGAALASGATVINTMRYRFGHDSPPGCAVIVMLDESHISIHTYAAEQLMAIDVFSCGGANAELIAERIKDELRLAKCKQQTIERF